MLCERVRMTVAFCDILVLFLYLSFAPCCAPQRSQSENDTAFRSVLKLIHLRRITWERTFLLLPKLNIILCVLCVVLACFRRIAPHRKWRLIEVNVTLADLEENRDHILKLIHPRRTVMDFNISSILWFGARGEGTQVFVTMTQLFFAVECLFTVTARQTSSQKYTNSEFIGRS